MDSSGDPPSRAPSCGVSETKVLKFLSVMVIRPRPIMLSPPSRPKDCAAEKVGGFAGLQAWELELLILKDIATFGAYRSYHSNQTSSIMVDCSNIAWPSDFALFSEGHVQVHEAGDRAFFLASPLTG